MAEQDEGPRRIRELEEALRPFAEFASGIAPIMNPGITVAMAPGLLNPAAAPRVTVGDFQEARAALAGGSPASHRIEEAFAIVQALGALDPTAALPDEPPAADPRRRRCRLCGGAGAHTEGCLHVRACGLR